MKKREFLAQLVAVVGVLFGPGEANANMTPAAPERVVEKPTVPATLKNAFVTARSTSANQQMAYHTSHVSHASHSSHVSHASNTSHYTGY